MKTTETSLLARCIHDFFTNYLSGVRGMSPHTQESYRDALVLLLRFLCSRANLHPKLLDLQHFTAENVIMFLNHLENERQNSVSSRNVRLAAIHAFFSYIGARYPEKLPLAQEILAIPFKRNGTPKPADYLEYEELDALFSCIDRSTPKGRRDYALFALMFNSGARVQEICNLRVSDLQLTRPFQVRLLQKGKKERICPLWPQTAQVIQDFLLERKIDLQSHEYIFLNHRGEVLTRFGVRYILSKYIETAKETSPLLFRKRLYPHSIRHSTAIHLLSSGVDIYSISQWLGHASINTTNKYAIMDLEMKRRVLMKSKPRGYHPHSCKKWRLDSNVLQWLESL